MPTNQRGSTLMLVTWMLLILGIVAVFLIYRAEAEWLAMVNAENSLSLREVAERALYENLAILLQDEEEIDQPGVEWFGETGFFSDGRDGCEVTVLVEDEGSKPNLNLMTESALCALLPTEAFDGESTPGLMSAAPSNTPSPRPELTVNPILDWLDADQDKRDGGAEAPDYQDLNPGYKCRDGFCSSLREIMMVKGGPELYPYLAPELTVYGKVNINTLTMDQFAIILEAAGFDKFDADSISKEFQEKQIMTRGTPKFEPITAMNILQNKLSLNSIKCKKLLPYLKFTGGSNVNLMSFKGLTAQLLLFTQGQIDRVKAKELALKIIRHIHEVKPIESVNELIPLLDPKAQELSKNLTHRFKLEDYFTCSSSLIRYRVWVVKGSRKYFINTVQERIPGDLRVKWRARTLSWRVLTNKAVPEIPALTPYEATLGLLDPEATTPGVTAARER
jgi:type II secretory pathway component PulK